MNSRRKTIIITGLLAILISYIVMTPKEEEKANFTLYIGDKAEQIEMTDDWGATKKIILTRVQPLWDDLESGESKVFYLQRVEGMNPNATFLDSIEAEHGEDVKVTSTATTTSPKWRFFKNRQTRSAEEGRSGIEYIEEDDSASKVLYSGNTGKWDDVRSYLDSNVLDIQGQFYSRDSDYSPK